MIGPLGKNLIFVIGIPRSGTTMLQYVLAGHSQVHATSEPWIMLHPLYALRDTSAEYWARGARAALDDFLQSTPEGITTFFRAVRAYGTELYNGVLAPTGKRCFMDKTPRYYYIIPELRKVFPSAKFIFVLRNPLALLASVVSSHGWALADLSRLSMSKADLLIGPKKMDEGLTEFGADAIVVRYEEFVEHPSPSLERITARLGIPYEASMLEYGARPWLSGTMGDVSVHDRSRPTNYRRDQWKHVLNSHGYLRKLADRYLERLDDGVLARSGYSKESLQTQLDSVKCSNDAPCSPEIDQSIELFFQ